MYQQIVVKIRHISRRRNNNSPHLICRTPRTALATHAPHPILAHTRTSRTAALTPVASTRCLGALRRGDRWVQHAAAAQTARWTLLTLKRRLLLPRDYERATKPMSAKTPRAATPPKATSCGGTSAPERASEEKKSGMSD